MASARDLYRDIVVILILLCILPSYATAVNVDLREGVLDKSQLEDVTVTFSIDVSDLPKQAAFLELESDLTTYREYALWNISTSEMWDISGGEDAFKEQRAVLTVTDEWTQPVLVTVSGKTPVITELLQFEGIVLTKRPVRRTGFTYYRIQALDDKGFPVGTAVTSTFNIVIPEEEQFKERLNEIDDTQLRPIIQEFYTKGLGQEAYQLLVYAETPRQATVPLWLFGIAIVIVAGAGFFIGQRRGIVLERKKRDIKGE
jgi:hypothetical protein